MKLSLPWKYRAMFWWPLIKRHAVGSNPNGINGAIVLVRDNIRWYEIFCRTQTQFGEMKYFAHFVAKFDEIKYLKKCTYFMLYRRQDRRTLNARYRRIMDRSKDKWNIGVNHQNNDDEIRSHTCVIKTALF